MVISENFGGWEAPIGMLGLGLHAVSAGLVGLFSHATFGEGRCKEVMDFGFGFLQSWVEGREMWFFFSC